MPEDIEFDQEAMNAAFEAAKSAPPADVLETPADEVPLADNIPAETPPPADTEVKFNPSDWLKTSTEGLIDSEEKFKEFIPKIKNYDDLETKLKDAQAKEIQFKNEESRKIYELIASGEDGTKVAYDYLTEKNRDYTTMSDLDVIRMDIAKKHPEWDSKGIELEVRGVYGKQLNAIDLESIVKEDDDGKLTQEYRDALAHNEKVEENAIRIQRDARDFRTALIKEQEKIELPQIKQAEAQPISTAPTAEELAERQKAWEKNVEENLPKLTDLKLNINDKEVEYVRTAEEKKELTDYMKTFNIFNFAKEQGWTNEDGTPNPLRIAEDVNFLKNRDKVLKSMGTQLTTVATKDTLKKIKNVTDEVPAGGETDVQPGSLAEALARARAEKGW